MGKHYLSIWIENKVGSLSKVVDLISKEGVNIDSAAVGVIASKNSTRITITIDANEEQVNKVIAKMNKEPNLIKIKEISEEESLLREMVLIKVDAKEEKRDAIINIVGIFHAKIVDVGFYTMTIEISGNKNKIDALVDLLNPYGIREIVRTGTVAIDRESRKP